MRVAIGWIRFGILATVLAALPACSDRMKRPAGHNNVLPKVKVAINTDDSVTESRFFLRTGAIAVRGGLSEDNALKALTLHGAQMLHLDERIGSRAAGNRELCAHSITGRWQPGDTFLLMSDALAALFLRDNHLEVDGFRAWISRMRAERLMRNDDVSLLHLAMPAHAAA